MTLVRAKKHLGQHFLTDKNIAAKIVDSLKPDGRYNHVLEVGPGMGILSDFLLQKPEYETSLIDIDEESYQYLQKKYPQLGNRLINADFLEMDFKGVFNGSLAIIGNFPYNISSQILFKVLDNRQQVVEVVGMFQKEVAERCAAKAGSKEYGILSVFLQAYYKVEYLFTVKAGVFNPPPKVLSAVIRLTRNSAEGLDCDEKLFWQIVKAGFNQRRKTLRNAISSLINKEQMTGNATLDLRAERLTVADFVKLTNEVAAGRSPQ
ncbi:16S rRNA (adenine(1518)-N(6)/adenine(1519)-N(6))-dimethyltransferase RsmA [Mucilaginibacter lappiensis]|uniref:Ribosomal RNA small subunit methyltransferase A n=1 Tax=Mucilaginibacter lappiensis TaxID=354630 RepID=A0A1N6ZWS9_9SPHI|nr:16S rRNA (adenine(1518)-N(6)/adenine(1519)-N(6))-dimethyltransferase RsmA [Mucilaginibacter lappiensis]MBB6110350.1 16S rRNA (adenine1518-N6/adenine1519-N6)-dimethyltransferase [Mucilaginibacter lappiensis]MBB6128542.1 16S rRNA (adenine1518-N6/adenine1519-N6)-dimethyltransferase [Mucilaginibacter lappiensis]SIR31278.1 16S rRNA (adenine1518-N6/adenine1519-N6)-dimethyltransferase [Mucilaginibacter lappiensis]